MFFFKICTTCTIVITVFFKQNVQKYEVFFCQKFELNSSFAEKVSRVTLNRIEVLETALRSRNALSAGRQNEI